MISIKNEKEIKQEKILGLYRSLDWSSADKPDLLWNALKNSHSLITAWDNDKLVGLGNAISDGYLVVYFPHLLVHPAYQGKGIGKMIVNELQRIYNGFHQQMLVADGLAVDFYLRCGFKKAGSTVPMWIYDGHEH